MSTALELQVCRACGAKMPTTFKFCGQCGSRLGVLLDTGSAERRLVTVLFCDMVGSTALSRRLDPEAFHNVLGHYLKTAAGTVHRNGGVVARSEGDGLVAFFGYPQANEDDPYRAVKAGLEMVPAIRDLNDRLLRPMSVRVHVRIGLHSGLVVVGNMGCGESFDPVSITGDPVNLAARLQQLAQPNTVIMSEATRRLVSSRVRTREIGLRAIKGVDESMLLHTALHVRSARPWSRSRLNAEPLPLVGREADFRVLTDRWREATLGATHFLVLVGESGIGKSRLISELKQELPGTKHTRLELFCSRQDAHTAFHPVIDLLRRGLRLGPSDKADAVRAKLADAIARYVLDEPDGDLDLLARLISGPLPQVGHTEAERSKRATIDLLSSLVHGISAQSPLLLVVEDVHWADPSTVELLDALIRRPPPSGLLCLLSCRTEFADLWSSRRGVSLYALSRLGSDQADELIRAVPGVSSLREGLVKQIVTRTDGVPLFIEELTKMLIATGDHSPCGSRPNSRPRGQRLAIPDTLQGLLAARLDSMGATKPLAQVAAALGREFSYELIGAVSDTSPL
ncbi:MAG: AAA family ATPase, partial [Pseudomonadota bacterium]